MYSIKKLINFSENVFHIHNSIAIILPIIWTAIPIFVFDAFFNLSQMCVVCGP